METNTKQLDGKQEYEVKFRFLGNEIFAIALSSTSVSNKWVIIALVSIFSILTILGAYGEKFVAMYNSIIG